MKRDLPKIRERNARIIEEYRTGPDGYAKLAKRFGVTRSLIRDTIKRQPDRIAIHRDHIEAVENVDESLTRQIYKEYNHGASVKALSRKYGLSSRTLYRRLTSVFLKDKDKREAVEHIDQIKRQMILESFEAGEKVGKIAKAFNVGGATVLKVLEKRIHEIWLGGESIGSISKRAGINRDTAGKMIQKIAIGLREERNERYKVISEGFAAGMTDEQISEREEIPIEWVRNVTRAFNKPRPNPWEIRIPLPEHKFRGRGNPQLRQFNDDEITLDLNPPEHARYLEVRNRRALIESEIVQNKFDTIPAIILNTYSSTVKTHNGSPF